MIKRSAARKNLFLLSIPTILVLAIVATLFWFFDRMKDANDSRNYVLRTINTSQHLLMAMVNAETGARGFVITGDEAMLKPYKDVQITIPTTLQELRDLSQTEPTKGQLDILAPLIDRKIAILEKAIALRKKGTLKDLTPLINSGEGPRVMDTIREEIAKYNRLQSSVLEYYDNQYRTNMNFLFIFLVCASIFMLMFAQIFAYGIYRNIHQRMMELVHQETKRSLDTQEAMNHQLNLAYVTLQDSEKKLEVTLNSIADAVIATDPQARVTLMNHVAEQITGWSLDEAMGRPIYDVFNMVDKETRELLTPQIMDGLLSGNSQSSLDSLLFTRDGSQCNIAASCSPMRDQDGQLIGAVLVFRDVTAENLAQQALVDSTALVQTILATVVDAIITFDVRTNLIETVNAAAEKMFGYSAEELIGKRFSSIVPELSEDKGSLDYYRLRPEDAANGLIREVPGLHKNGYFFPMEITVSEMRLGGQRYFTGVLRNISARKQAEANVRASEDRYRSLFNSIDEGFCTIEMIYDNGKPVDYFFVEVNPSFEKQTGLKDAQGKRISELVPDLDEVWFEIYGRVAATGEAVRFVQESIAMDRWFDVYACPDQTIDSKKVIVLFTDITERKRAEDALQESDERMRLATEATGVGIWEWNLVNNTLHWDPQMFRIYGLDPTENGLIDHNAWTSYILPEDVHAQQDALQQAIRSGSQSIREFRITPLNGGSLRYIRSVETMRVNSRGQVVSIVGTNLDITDRKRTEDTLRENERHLRAVIDALPVAIITTDAKGALTHFNQAAVEFCGRMPQLGSDQWCVSLKLLRPDGSALPHDQCPMAIALQQDRQILGAEAISERPDGSRVWFTAHPTPLHDASGKLIGGINMMIDVTERKRLDKVLLENNIELKKAKNLADKANLAKSDFLSNMSHELRTPLSAILGFAQLLASSKTPPSPAQKRSIDQILHAGWYLLDLINEILDLTLIESGKLSFSIEQVSLSALLDECYTMIEPQALKRNVTMDFSKPEQEVWVKADHTRLKQVLINLLSNAVKYNRIYGKVTVTFNEETEGRIRLFVEDTGEGLTPEKISQLFQPFNRLGKENSAVEGTGIGLVMTKRLIELMGGEIDVKSVVGQGTVFSIELDLFKQNQIEDNNDSERNSAALKVPKSIGNTQTLLYIEDNPANLMLVEDIIESRTDLKLLSARDGYTGIEIARNTLPDLILMDINLPGINGTDALKILAKDPLTSHIPVIALSANAIPRDIEKGLASGFFRYLTKPIKIHEFIETLEQALRLDTEQPVEKSKEKIV
ncbi:MAG: PAS domain S-box protein [Cellvibrio sp.]